MDKDRAASRRRDGGGGLRHFNYYRPSILVLLMQREGHGYDLNNRLTDLGFGERLVSSLYGALRDMENEELISSSWDLSRQGGPPRRVYVPTAAGERFLRESIPALARQRHALDAVLDLYMKVSPGACSSEQVPSAPTHAPGDDGHQVKTPQVATRSTKSVRTGRSAASAPPPANGG